MAIECFSQRCRFAPTFNQIAGGTRSGPAGCGASVRSRTACSALARGRNGIVRRLELRSARTPPGIALQTLPVGSAAKCTHPYDIAVFLHGFAFCKTVTLGLFLFGIGYRERNAVLHKPRYVTCPATAVDIRARAPSAAARRLGACDRGSVKHTSGARQSCATPAIRDGYTGCGTLPECIE